MPQNIAFTTYFYFSFSTIINSYSMKHKVPDNLVKIKATEMDLNSKTKKGESNAGKLCSVSPVHFSLSHCACIRWCMRVQILK